MFKEESYATLNKEYSQAVFCLLQEYFRFSAKDICHFNNNMQHLLIKEFKERTNVKILYTVHVSLWKVFFENDRQGFKRAWENRDDQNLDIASIQGEAANCNMADSVICLSRSTYDDVLGNYGINDDKLRLVPNGIELMNRNEPQKDVSVLRKELGIDPNATVFLFVGRLIAQKGIDIALKAFEAMAEKWNGQIQMVVVGKGYYKKIIEKRKHIEGTNVIVTGYVPPTEIYKYYRSADILVFPTKHEQSSYVILEAMKYGLPMIVSDIRAFDFLCPNKHCLKIIGNHIDENVVQTWADAMYALAVDREKGDTLSKNAYKLIQESFDSETMFRYSYGDWL
jgi:glycosyltransferase involved in cell wall biosynthesis